MMGIEQAIDFCEYLAKTRKYDGDGTEFVQIAELLRFLKITASGAAL